MNKTDVFNSFMKADEETIKIIRFILRADRETKKEIERLTNGKNADEIEEIILKNRSFEKWQK